MRRFLVILALAALGGCSDTIVNECLHQGTTPECVNGLCEPLPDRPTVLYCVFYDQEKPTCPSGLRWDPGAPGADANACYVPMGDGGVYLDMSMPEDMPANPAG